MAQSTRNTELNTQQQDLRLRVTGKQGNDIVIDYTRRDYGTV